MWNWIKFITVFLLSLASVITILVFYNAYKPIATEEEKAREVAIKSGQLVTVQSTEIFNGTNSMVTVFGKDQEGNEKAVFVGKNKQERYDEVLLADGITAKKALDVVKKELDVQKVMHVSLGVMEEDPMWEIAFKSGNGQLNYVYLSFKNGQWKKRILNL
ncbi:DUF5590 domain-containing protein [Sporosarcina sp. HYO08]|uniref:cell wall elongation regulator TseB-like domain-containing protein n=1 Tax=Sporosarcina sp. HYO08 TaxID=1759557 RepID=UPI0007988E32|nr:DUF5590 domain-containing protein [Sporosarcina sp. HYO08]KXH81993.1 hypothetical protein AU377_06995 [Sporosarcina sp. HYO08]